ncbi:hypothetical protein EDD37DRAFT_10452 [Exophiala viscosa]|uniref:Uncharacterized protein n=1 Tax=Exophiala viscosa TaxID=2486360 RepID=A0AAN6DNB9_9EURO|nr:hypothetical protein EDD36DRAFT_449198 [Exophiala viscosa]KAI1628497.1 hypothetical protein EDD37DRAFT_10452 [Exophiala viscosa]
MPKGLTAARCIPHQTPRSVWVSDALLAETFTRFCHHRRHGSNVPGPLEAQRRAARRKNTNLAHSGCPPVSLDPAIVFGRNRNSDWWQSPTNRGPAQPTASRLLPSWLFPILEAEPRPVPRSQDESKTIPRPPDRNRERRLSQCSNLQDIREWLQETGGSIGESPALSAAIQKHMLKTEFRGEEIAAYICDPSFHPPGTSFIRRLIPAIFECTWEVHCWQALRAAIGKAAELGLIGISDIQTILDFATASRPIKLHRPDGKIEQVKSRERMHLIRITLDSLARSKVLTVANLEGDFLSNLFCKLASLSASRLTSDSVGALWRLMPWAGVHDAPVVSRLIFRNLRDRCRDHADGTIGEKIAQQLQIVDVALLRSAILHTTAQLVEDTQGQSKSSHRYLLYHWMGVLQTLGSTRSMVQPTMEDWARFKSNTVEPDTDRALLVFAWTSLHLSRHWRLSSSLSDRLQAYDLFSENMLSIPEFVAEGFLDRALPDLETLPLPNREVLLRDLTTIAGQVGTTSKSEDATSSNVKGVNVRGSLIPIEDGLYRDMRGRYNEALAELSDCLLKDPLAFQTVSRRLIWKNSTSFTIISRILDNNTSLKLALSRTAQHPRIVPERTRPHDHATSIHDVRKLQGDGENPGLGLASTVLDVVNHLAVSCATSPVVSPREALRRVHWCYRFLHRYGAPIESTLTKALWHAGVARYAEHGYGEFGTAKTLLRWILSQIKMAEGEDVARRLLWSPAFRAQRRLEMNELAKLKDVASFLPAKSEGQDAHDSSTNITTSLDGLRELGQAEKTDLSADMDHAIEDLGCDFPIKQQAMISIMSDLEIWQKIRHVNTVPHASPFWHEKSVRKELWEKAQVAKQAGRGSQSSYSGRSDCGRNA